MIDREKLQKLRDHYTLQRNQATGFRQLDEATTILEALDELEDLRRRQIQAVATIMETIMIIQDDHGRPSWKPLIQDAHNGE